MGMMAAEYAAAAYAASEARAQAPPNEPEPEAAPMPESFTEWARDWREAAAVRLRSAGRGGSGGTARWWATLPDDLRCYLLSQQDKDGWERWMGAEWAALPDALRTCVAINARQIRRDLEGCTWR